MLTAAASGASAYGDPPGDDNAAPDIVSVTVSESADTLDVLVDVANHDALPAGSRFNLWFDLDGNSGTGDATGDDALVRFTSDGAVELRRWDGTGFVSRAAPGLTAGYERSRLSVSVPSAALGSMSSPGILVVGARSTLIAGQTLTTADFAPESGRARWLRQTTSSFLDVEGDHDAAPDITAIRVSDQRSGWIRFAISTPNRVRLPETALVSVTIDRDSDPGTGDRGSEVLITASQGGVELERWDATRRRWVDDRAPTRAAMHNSGGAVEIDVHRSELDDVERFAFRVFSADRSLLTGALVAVDFAPDSGAFWRYRLTNAGAPRLVAGTVVGSPARPRAGKAFAVTAPVRRSDTSRAIASGTARCDVRADATRIPSTGSVRAGHGRCELVVPASARSISGSMTIRSGGKTVTARFRFSVR